MEEWKEIKGFEGIYSISNQGRVKSEYSKRVVTGTTNGKNYRKVHLWKNGKYRVFYIHRLVAMHFVPNPNGLTEVNHIDGCPLNNRAENLEWVNSSQNTIHAVLTTKHLIPWNNQPKAIITTDIANGKEIYFDTLSMAERELGSRHIVDVLKGRRNTCKGYTFRYALGGDAYDNATN